MASRGSLSVLESTTPLSHSFHAARPLIRKRKTCHTAVEWANQTINIRAHAASLSDEPFVLEPIAVVPRSRLPFSWLEPPSALSPIQPGSLFVADIPVLEPGSPRDPPVLAVRLLSDGGIYVVERVKAGIYALSKLARDVGEGDIFVAVKGWSPSALEEEAGPVANGAGEWWELARIEDPVLEPEFSTKRAKFDVSVVFGVAGVADTADARMKDISPRDSTESRAQSLAPPRRSSSSDAQVQMFGSIDAVVSGAEEARPDALQSPQELLDNLREQYLQALYVSKTSVAYFAKGPLTRCRAGFQSPDSESATPADLINFYQEAILTAKKMDLKYRETLPTTIQDAMLAISDEEPGRKKKGKSRKEKMGKNGLYPGEDRFVRQWWRDRAMADMGATIELSREAEVKKNVADLRMRETQLQILLILETMALEAAAAVAAEAKKPEESGGEPTDKSPKKKTKKLQELKVMLELHLDRLCIWHAVNFEDTGVSETAKASGVSGKKVESDAVRDFCTEVIIPFYASRIPDKCKAITRKLGVSGVMPSSSSSKQSQTKKTPQDPEPGAAERKPQKHPRRSFQRVLTDSQTTSQAHPPSLNRSNTAPSNPNAKSDSIDPPLPSLSTSVRGGIQKAKRVENREVDLIAVARQHETKLKKVQLLVDQKKELDAAIHTLRKPNRELVAKDIAEDADKRRTGGSGRKPKNPVRNPLGQGVQVAATPKGGRKKDAVIGMPPLPRSLTRSSTQPKGSSAALFGGDGSPRRNSSSGAVRPNLFSGTPMSRNPGIIHDTPSRRPAQPVGSYDDGVTSIGESPSISKNLFRIPQRPAPRSATTDMLAPSTPVSSRHVDAYHDQPHHPGPKSSMVMETPPKKGPAGPVIQETPPPAKIFSTPVKGGSSALRVPAATGPPVTPEKSIYEQLGWDDEMDL
ncbi:hypothetical protein P170DRAFT_393995 [Aspergillus steynii IBT 23096]|uniref:DNA replication regulator Sld3 C-terminal domain-containing protein n=1 Tax=Aspergillus steynii IBT 23096 TaxID=1392250 RepID=A0A2I2FTF8_9EURO|nr:uncharacterized protein P170DRAFT_393995 [Aspergillus steynii IBT 23096]PLB43919.1 hypothetical protein P170DRAFT_393995 [Aspergillus steynii IBT 23096]